MSLYQFNKARNILICFYLALFGLAFCLISSKASAACSTAADSRFVVTRDETYAALNSQSWESVREGSAQRFGYILRNSGTKPWGSPGSSSVLAARMYDYRKIRNATSAYFNQTTISVFGGRGLSGNFDGLTTGCLDGQTPYGSSNFQSDLADVPVGWTWNKFIGWTPTSSDIGYHSVWSVIRTSDGTTSVDFPNTTSNTVGGFTTDNKHNWTVSTWVVPYNGYTSSTAYSYRKDNSSTTYTQTLGPKTAPTVQVSYRNTSGSVVSTTTNNSTVTISNASQNIRVQASGATGTVRYYFKYRVNSGAYQENILNRDDPDVRMYNPAPLGHTWGQNLPNTYPVANWGDMDMDGSIEYDEDTISISPGNTYTFCAQVKDVPGNISQWNCLNITFVTIAPKIQPLSSVSASQIYVGQTATFTHRIVSTDYSAPSFTANWRSNRDKNSVQINPTTQQATGTQTVSANATYTPRTSSYTGLAADVGKYICENLDITSVSDARVTILLPDPSARACVQVIAGPKIQPLSSVSASQIYVGQTATFTHRIVSTDYSAPSFTANWRSNRDKNSVQINPTTQQATGTQSVSASTTYTPRTSSYTALESDIGLYICENLDITSVSDARVTILPPDPSARACVQVIARTSFTPLSSASKSTVYANGSDTVTFTHRITTANLNGNPTVSYIAKSGLGTSNPVSKPTTEGSGTHTPSANGTITVVSDIYTVPAGLAIGTLICEDLTLSSPTDGSVLSQAISNEACAEVVAQPTLEARVNVEPKYAEATETVQFTHLIYAQNNSGNSVSYVITRSIGTASPTNVQSGSATVSSDGNTVIPTAAYTIPDVPLGTEICETLSLSNPSGGAMITVPMDSDCMTVGARPYAKFFGGDVKTCEAGAGILTSAKFTGSSYIGSSVQYAAFAVAAIDGPVSNYPYKGFYSKSESVGTEPKQLTFANTVEVGPFGGSFGESGTDTECFDYYQQETSSSEPIQADKSITGLSINNSYHINDVVNGDAYITNNITYANTNWLERSEIPSYRLLVDGNIYISGNVTRLDGFYFATGNIYTCSTGSVYNPASDLNYYDTCKLPLKVFGALQAQGSIKLWRTTGLMHAPNAIVSENDNTQCALIGCNNVAEQIILSPELYLSQWQTASQGISDNKFDNIRSYPPVF